MRLNTKYLLFIIVLLDLILLVGCKNDEIETSTLVDDLQFEVISITPGLNADTDITINMTNNSKYKIVQNTVLYSIRRTSFEDNEILISCTQMSKNNELNINPGESIDLVFSYPSSILKKEFEDSTFTSEFIHFVGYFDELDEKTRFEFIKSLSSNKK